MALEFRIRPKRSILPTGPAEARGKPRKNPPPERVTGKGRMPRGRGCRRRIRNPSEVGIPAFFTRLVGVESSLLPGSGSLRDDLLRTGGSMHPMPITREEALAGFEAEGADFTDLLARADRVRETAKGRWVRLCGIINAKSGRCSENCAFCAQSAAPRYTDRGLPPGLGRGPARAGAGTWRRTGSGNTRSSPRARGIRLDRELDVILRVVETLREEGRVLRCASLGILPIEVLERLKAAGLTKYHHNLETARSFFGGDLHEPRLRRRRGHDPRREGPRGSGSAREASSVSAKPGPSAWSSPKTLIELGVDSVPVNFLHAIPGTRLEDRPPLPPRECLKILAVLRLMMPDADIYVCGGAGEEP